MKLTDEQIEAGRRHVFSTDNPFCPCDAKTMRKAVRWAEAELEKQAAGHVLVPLDFVRQVHTLAHNYSLNAEGPDYYRGTERDAFSNAYRRCGDDLAKLRAMLAPPSPAGTTEGGE